MNASEPAPVSACLAAALDYARHGWRVLPVRGKVPVLPGWSRPDGDGAASTDPDTIRAWWTRWPTANVGVATGPASNLAVLDVDPRHGGGASFAALEERVGVLPGTVVSLTGGGGVHLLYAHPGRKVTSRAHSLGAGLDVKADGGMIVAPPSVHPDTGTAYRWLGGAWQDPLPVWPAALLPPVELVRAPVVDLGPGLMPGGGGRPERRLEALVQFVMDGQPGERNARLFWASCRGHAMVLEGQVGEQVVREALRLAGDAVGLAAGEVAATVASAFAAGRVSA